MTITTVGYGDRFPVTLAGRITAAFVMFAGVGIIGSLASILASVLVPCRETEEEPEEVPATGTVRDELAEIRAELSALRRSLSVGGEPPGS